MSVCRQIGRLFSCLSRAALPSPSLPAKQGLPQGTELIRQAQNDCLPAPGQPREIQRPHMTINHLPLLGIEPKRTVRIFQRPVRMVKAMPLVIAVFVMPVIEIQVMQKSTPHQSCLIGPQVKAPIEPKAHPGYISTVAIGGDAAVLDIVTHLPGFGGIGRAQQQPMQHLALLPG